MELKHVARGELRPREPFNLALTLSAYSFHWYYDGSKGYLPLLDDPVTVAVVYEGGEGVVVDVYSEEGWVADEALRLTGLRLGLGEDLAELYEKAVGDPLLAGLATELRGWRLRSTSPWWALVVGVCQQNASFRQGWGMLYRITRLMGRRVLVAGREVYLPPSPVEVLERRRLLAEARVGYRARTIVRVAEAFTRGELCEDVLEGLELGEAEALLTRIKGVGSYTARLALVLGLRRYELPPVDRWVRRIASEAYEVPPREVEDYWKRRWGRWSGLAVVALTLLLDAEPLTRALQRLREGGVTPRPSGRPTPLTMWMFEEL